MDKDISRFQKIIDRYGVPFEKRLPGFLYEFLIFGVKSAYACVFGGLLLFLILITNLVEIPLLHRYDFLFLSAVLIQILLIFFRLEKMEEVKVIFLFHAVGTVMEVFKTSEGIGSWSYPEESFFYVGNVPLFSGFMYAAVGSYIARSFRIFHLKYEYFPSLSLCIFCSALIYVNFFTHHFIWDIRILLFGFVGFLFWKTKVYFLVHKTWRWMPMLVAFFLIAFFLWIAENVGTFGNAWVYPEQQDGWQLVSFDKMGSWFLLMILSFVMVAGVHRESLKLKR